VSGRIPCIVPFCRCTAAADKFRGATEIICGKHWRPVSAETKARYRQVKRRRDKVWRLTTKRGGGITPDVYEIARNAVDATWERRKAEAIERAAGI
jgi:hypothetical protein